MLVGEEDVAEMQAIATHLADSLEDARLVVIREAGHVPSLERVDEVNALLLSFLGEK